MIEVKSYQLAEIVPRTVIDDFRSKIRAGISDKSVPTEVLQFIEALAGKMPDFGRNGIETFCWSGQSLLLAGMKEFNGEPVDPIESYSVEFPKLQAVDHRSTMLRLFHKKGKQGLVDYLKARLSGTRLKSAMHILSVEVFHEKRSNDYEKMMDEIKASKKFESEVDLEERV